MQLYMITNRRLFDGDPDQATRTLLDQAMPWVEAGLSYLQIREKDLPPAGLGRMAALLRSSVIGMAQKKGQAPPAVLVNAGDEQQLRVACNLADGVHLPGGSRSLATRVAEARALWLAERPNESPPVLSVSCHTAAEVEEARAVRVSAILFAPVFEKPIWEHRPPGAVQVGLMLPGVGLAALRDACNAAGPVPVFALGGVTLENAADCLAVGAAGIAGVRLFAGESWRTRV